MPVIKLSLTDNQFKRLNELAGKKSIQQYLRELAGVEEDLFTPQEAVRRVKEKFENSPPSAGETFTFCLPDLYEDEEGWRAFSGKIFSIMLTRIQNLAFSSLR